MTSKKKKIVIIGAGIAGLTAGALLLKKGYKVTIYEKQSTIGGRALSIDGSTVSYESYKKALQDNNCFISFSTPDLNTIFKNNLLKDYTLDLGYHAIGGGVFSNLNEILKFFDESLHFLESYVGMIYEDHYDFPFLSRIDKLKIMPNILRLLFASEKTLKHLDTIPITETIQKYGKGKMKHILEVFSRTITTVNNLDRISTGEMFRSQRNLYRGSKPVGYPIGGLESIHEKLQEIILSLGGEIMLNSPVEKIIIKENKATHIQINGERIAADMVIYSGLLQQFFTIADSNEFPKEYVTMISSLTGTGSLCAYYSLNKIPSELIGKTFHFIERDVGVDGNDVVGMVDFMSASPEANISPKNAFLIQSYAICTPEEAKDKLLLERLKGILDKNLMRLIPDYPDMMNFVLYPSVWHLDGVAKTIDNQKPSIKTPIHNLFFIGDGVKATGIGFNCALNSAKKLIDTYVE